VTWVNTWLCGPGVHQMVLDEIELGRIPAMYWSWGRVAVPRACSTPEALRRMDPCPTPCYPQRGQRTLFDRGAT